MKKQLAEMQTKLDTLEKANRELALKAAAAGGDLTDDLEMEAREVRLDRPHIGFASPSTHLLRPNQLRTKATSYPACSYAPPTLTPTVLHLPKGLSHPALSMRIARRRIP